ncbi:hypothetical protein AUP68_15062 [Ilyonectria robusta]
MDNGLSLVLSFAGVPLAPVQTKLGIARPRETRDPLRNDTTMTALTKLRPTATLRAMATYNTVSGRVYSTKKPANPTVRSIRDPPAPTRTPSES